MENISNKKKLFAIHKSLINLFDEMIRSDKIIFREINCDRPN